MTQAFLNEPSIEQAHEAYLKRWHLDSVKTAWNGRKPSIAQFKKRFGKAYSTRQAWLARHGQGATAVAVAEDQKLDVAQSAAEKLLELLSGIAATEEPEVEEDLGPVFVEESEKDTLIEKLARMSAPVSKQEPEQRFVKPENFDELPRSGQVYFFLHRAKEAGFSYAIVPLKRGVAAEAISQIKDDGRDYGTVASDLISAR